MVCPEGYSPSRMADAGDGGGRGTGAAWPPVKLALDPVGIGTNPGGRPLTTGIGFITGAVVSVKGGRGLSASRGLRSPPPVPAMLLEFHDSGRDYQILILLKVAFEMERDLPEAVQGSHDIRRSRHYLSCATSFPALRLASETLVVRSGSRYVYYADWPY